MFVAMARLGRPVGLRGELRAWPLRDFVEEVLATGYVRRQAHGGSPIACPVAHWRHQGERLVLKLRGVDHRDAAQQLVGDLLGFESEDYEREDFPRPQSLPPFTYEGLRVWTTTGEAVGTIREVLDLPGGLVLRVRRDGDEDVLIPAVPPLLERVDRGAGLVIVRPIPGLLDGQAWIDDGT